MASQRSPPQVEIGTSALEKGTFVRDLTAMINRGYGHQRVNESDVAKRLNRGDAARNRVLHVAFRDGTLVGCCSSTLHTPWTGPGTGHWGLLVVDPAAQGTGVASALVAAAEGRCYAAGLRAVAIEYNYTAGDPFSERLRVWYEEKCAYVGPRWRGSGFRMCRKRLADSTALLCSSASALSSGSTTGSRLPVWLRWLCAVCLWLFCGLP